MKIATNIHRDAFNGITISNLALFDWLEQKKDTIIGIEYVITRHGLGPVIFRNYNPAFFSHHIINGIDIIPRYSWERMWSMKSLRKRWSVLVETTKDVLKREMPDIVLINGTYYAPWILARAAKELGIPVVLRYAGVLQREIEHRGFVVRKRLLVYERWLADMADAIIFPSQLCREVVQNEILGHSVRCGVVVPNPVTKQKTVIRQKKTGRYTIAAIGRWSSIKNFQAFIALHKELLRKRWPHRAIMVTSFRDEKFGIPQTMEQIASMSHDDICKFYRSINLLVVPSRFETFCNVAAEALVSGTPVLVSKNVGFSEILRKAGLEEMVIESFDNPTQVASAVRRLAGSHISKEKYKTVAELIDSDLIHNRILKVLREVLRNKK